MFVFPGPAIRPLTAVGQTLYSATMQSSPAVAPTETVQHKPSLSETQIETIFVVVTLVAMVGAKGLELAAGGAASYDTAIAALYVIAYIAGGAFGLKESIAALRRGAVEVDLLMVLAALGAAADLTDRLVVTDREAIVDLLPRLAAAAQRRDAATVLAAIDPAIRPLREEAQALLDRLRPEEIRITRLDVTVDRTATPRTATADLLVRYVGDVGGPGGPATGQALVPLVLRLHKPADAWLVTEARIDDDAPLGARRPTARP